jgi:hypothetical protein
VVDGRAYHHVGLLFGEKVVLVSLLLFFDPSAVVNATPRCSHNHLLSSSPGVDFHLLDY